MKGMKCLLRVVLLLSFYAISVQAYPTVFFDKLEKLPDYWQRIGDFGDYGDYYCGPVAAANSIMYFDTFLDDGIVPDDEWRDLVSKLAGDDYFKTDWNINEYRNSSGKSGTLGTYFSDMISGIDKYLDEYFEPGFDVKNQWWTAGGGISIDWVKSELSRCEDVIFLVGWYYLDTSKNEWVRDGGHYVTLAGYDEDEFWISDPWNEGPTHDRYNFAAWGANWELVGYNGGNKAMIEGVISASPIPEPVSALLLGAGLVFFSRVGRRKRALHRTGVKRRNSQGGDRSENGTGIEPLAGGK